MLNLNVLFVSVVILLTQMADPLNDFRLLVEWVIELIHRQPVTTGFPNCWELIRCQSEFEVAENVSFATFDLIDSFLFRDVKVVEYVLDVRLLHNLEHIMLNVRVVF